MLFFAAVTSLLVCVHGFVPQLNGRIVGGELVDISQAPSTVSMHKDFFNNGTYLHACGGSIISRGIVLTAAHCTNGTLATQWKVRAGSTFLDRFGQVTNVSRIVEHRLFNSRYDYDIALVFLTDELVLGPGVVIAELPFQGQMIAEGSNATISGWGTMTEGGSATNDLQKAIAPVVNQQACISAYDGVNSVTDRMSCVGRMGIGGVGACQGDSGGPIVINGVLHGIMSWGDGCARPNRPTVGVRVALVYNWIFGVIHDLFPLIHEDVKRA